MQHPKPIAELIVEICGGKNTLHIIEAAHHGLSEIRFNDISHILNLTEIIDIASSSWVLRDNIRKEGDNRILRQDESDDPIKEFEEYLNNSNLFEIFKYVVNYKQGTYTTQRYNRILRYNRNVRGEKRDKQDALIELYQKLNPFPRENLEERLSLVIQPVVVELKKRLLEEPSMYVPEKHYGYIKQITRGNHRDLVIMDFLPDKPSKGWQKVAVQKYAELIEKILATYPQLY